MCDFGDNGNSIESNGIARNHAVQLTIVTHVSFSERLAIANIHFYQLFHRCIINYFTDVHLKW